MAKLNEGISQIKKGSALETMYNRLLTGLEQASHETLPDFTGPDYVDDYIVNEEKINLEIHEYEDITRKNSAYLLANTIISSLSSEEGGGSGTGGFVSINGDSMAGLLKALYGFSAGANGIKILDVYRSSGSNLQDIKNIVSINGELHLPSHGLYINNWNVLSYNNDILSLDAGNIALNGDVTCSGHIRLGELEISKDGISYKGNEFYHSGNSNKEDVNWTMKDSTVAGKLSVKGTSLFQGAMTALNSVSLGVDNVSVFSISSKRLAQLTGDLNIITGGIQFDGNYIIHVKNNNVISFSASNKILNLGDDGTKQINLQTSIYDDDGEYEMISKFGSAYFPESFKAGHNLGNVLIETYKKSSENSGVIFQRYIRLKSEDGPGFYSDGDTLFFEAPFKYNKVTGDESVQISEVKNSSFGYVESLSLYAPLNRKSSSLMFSTDADFFVFDKAIEGKKSIGIADSKTRLLSNELFFDDSIYWLALDNGVKHYGNAYFVNNIGSVTFSSGFAGNGWGIIQNQLTGNISATFDELTIRKKMRIYELEVQKQSVTNGSQWVSDACSGDLVEEVP
jgi:hypothetical protein